MTNEKQLKHCPFCAGTATASETVGHRWSVECDECPCFMGHYNSEEEAIDAWNTRKESVWDKDID